MKQRFVSLILAVCSDACSVPAQVLARLLEKIRRSLSLCSVSLFSPPHEARAISLPKDQIVSSITEVEKTIDLVQEVNSGFLYTAQSIFQIAADALKPGVDVAAPLLQKAGEQAIKIASPALSEASKKAQEAMQSSGVDMRSLS